MRILIADDESIIRLGLKAMLTEQGHEVLAAANGREALQMARRHQPDLAILDIKMPYTDGLQAAQTISRTCPMPILLLTAFSEQDLIDRATDLPIHGYLIKPIKPEELAAAIAVASKRFRESRQQAAHNARLERDLATRKIIERAKGKLMQQGMSEAAAYQTLQRRARANRQTLAETARAILDTSS